MRIVFLVIMAMLIQHCHAQTWTDERTGYAWTYVIENDTAIIRNGEYMYSAREAISPRPTGSVRIPATLGGYLFKDFDLMFDELYDDSARERKEVLKVLAERPMTVSEIAGALGRAKNGHIADLVCFGGGIV